MLDYLGLGSPPCEQNKPVAAESCQRRPPASQWSLSRTRRVLDFSIALLLLLVSAIPMAIIAACVRFTSSGSALFSQERVGRDGRQILVLGLFFALRIQRSRPNIVSARRLWELLQKAV